MLRDVPVIIVAVKRFLAQQLELPTRRLPQCITTYIVDSCGNEMRCLSYIAFDFVLSPFGVW